MTSSNLWMLSTIVGLACVTVLARSFFLLSAKPWSLPRWVQRGLHYAPIAALAAVIVPEIVMTQGHLVSTWQDARVYSAVAGALWFFWRGSMLGTLLVGMAVYLPLHVGLGW